jgi:RNA polymerase sigma-70 factor, ECF subfamily
VTAGVPPWLGAMYDGPRPPLNAIPLSLERAGTPAQDAVDPDTIHRASLGEVPAFTRIVQAYYPRCMRFARGMLHDAQDAEDVVQETFVRVFRALPRYEDRQRFESWLFHILGNCCRTAAKKKAAAASAGDSVEQIEQLPSAERADRTFDHEWSVEVRQALADVPDYNREVFLLHYVEGFSYEEIERMTGVRKSALKMRVKRASDALRARLKDRRIGHG